MDREFDVVVIGGGPAGLQAALTLGRMHRRVLLLDSGEYRNAAAVHMHNFATWDGAEPGAYRAAARAQLAAYETVLLREACAEAIERDAAGWAVQVDGERMLARNVLLATGVRDALPQLDGLLDLWGDAAAHCPYCHGHEFTGKHVAIVGAGAHALRFSVLLARIAERITILTNGEALEEETARQLDPGFVSVRSDRIEQLVPADDGALVVFESGERMPIGGLFVSTTMSQSAPFAADLGLELLASGCVRIDAMGRTSEPGIYAAGDLAHTEFMPGPLASVLTAAAAGLVAASAIDQDMASATLAARTA